MAKILVVDDQGMFRKQLAEIFRLEQHEVIEARTGGEGLEKLAEQPDIIFCNPEMPMIDGIDFPEQFKTNAEYSRYSGVPLIAVGSVSPDNREHFTEHVQTPLIEAKINTLIGYVKQYCNK